MESRSCRSFFRVRGSHPLQMRRHTSVAEVGRLAPYTRRERTVDPGSPFHPGSICTFWGFLCIKVQIVTEM